MTNQTTHTEQDSELLKIVRDFAEYCTVQGTPFGDMPNDWQELTKTVEKLAAHTAKEVAAAQTNGVAWTIRILDELHIGRAESDTTDRLFKGIKNTIRDRYKAEVGDDPAPNYPITAQLQANNKGELENE